MAQHLVVESRDVAEFAGKARFAGVQFAVDDNSQTQTPADVDEQHVALVAGCSAHKFAVGHGASVVVDAYGIAQALLQQLRQWAVAEIEICVAVALFGVDASRKVHVDVHDFLAVDGERIDELRNYYAYFFESFGRIVELIFHVECLLNHVAFHVNHAHAYGELLDVDAYKVAAIGT